MWNLLSLSIHSTTFPNYLKLKCEDQGSKSALSKSFNSTITKRAYGGWIPFMKLMSQPLLTLLEDTNSLKQAELPAKYFPLGF